MAGFFLPRKKMDFRLPNFLFWPHITRKILLVQLVSLLFSSVFQITFLQLFPILRQTQSNRRKLTLTVSFAHTHTHTLSLSLPLSLSLSHSHTHLITLTGKLCKYKKKLSQIAFSLVSRCSWRIAIYKEPVHLWCLPALQLCIMCAVCPILYVHVCIAVSDNGSHLGRYRDIHWQTLCS